MKYIIDILLFDGFETLDVFGPVEVFGSLPEIFQLNFISAEGEIVKSSQNVKVHTDLYKAENGIEKILLIPGGVGTRDKVYDKDFLEFIKCISSGAKYVLSVCTGAALLAKAKILDGKKATTNKRAFKWVTEQSMEVTWIKEARWIRDENIYTSSGVSAGIDMALGFVQDLMGKETALDISKRIEYLWNEDSDYDPFCSLYENI